MRQHPILHLDIDNYNKWEQINDMARIAFFLFMMETKDDFPTYNDSHCISTS